MNRTYIRYAVAIIFICCIALLRYSNLASMLNLAWLNEHVAELTTYVQQHYTSSVCIYIATYICASVCALPGSTIFIMAGGFLFGVLLGCLYAAIGALTGSLLLFLLSRYVIGASIQERYADRFTRFNNAIEKNGFYYLVIVRLAGVIPFFIVNLLSGITLLPISHFLAATACGMLPALVVYSFIGEQLLFVQASDMMTSPFIVGAYILFFLLRIIMVPFIAQRAQIL